MGTPADNKVEIHGNSIYFYSGVDVDRILELNDTPNPRELKSRTILLEYSRSSIYTSTRPEAACSPAAAMDVILKLKLSYLSARCQDLRHRQEHPSVVGTERVIPQTRVPADTAEAFVGKYADARRDGEPRQTNGDDPWRVYKEYTKVPVKKLDDLKRDIWFDAKTCSSME